ncbi:MULTISPECIES: type II toxin-antitoxin system VapC family toxin [Pasteurellaceae]|uniref:PIN domain-containing protein n=1 Tax=Pasteurella atlantica TaxID=2827233 RepID=A0AAW8CKM8_9PAST|nr:PIN domain-containing protein [Pasteurella atlantica]MBR0574246.1 PIN domain-containing protein [Pasteurella atlantica]MDP8038534.1 PIN domain-containing protein [Pasteurella atlantica]MDP8040626.1 PIN domain-containing protein [Pasteurella atlantica]MDP8042760.1 PIN domain-containing protein [Pasteurella atlantica]MDP8044848.1 PIN domain-containing protein [Pasteurella atlantica]
MQQILIDSGPLIALFDASDRYHNKTIEFIQNNKSTLITTLASITEVLHLLDFNRNAQLDFLEWISREGIQIADIQQTDFVRIKALTDKYLDLPMDFADSCLVLLAEKMGIKTIATIDRDFTIYRINGKQAFETILL